MREQKWVVMAKGADFHGIARRFSIDPIVARLIRNRDVVGDEAIQKYLYGGRSDLYDPFLMKDMDKAVATVAEAIAGKKRIRIIGDYDIDGICATYILSVGLKTLGAKVDYAIPDRIKDGYGINESLVADAHAAGVEVLLTCDN
ncbi:MAG: DHH family phosphoesterase, partial [Lachnospiraceae bacterium]